jgi:hypothetical protein
VEIDGDGTPRVDRWWPARATGWLFLQLLLTVFAVIQTIFSTLSVASCTPTSCDYSAFSTALNTLYIGAVALLFASVVAVAFLRRHGRAVIWSPIVSSVLLVLLFAVTYIAGRGALALPLFGNRLSD